MSAISAMKNNGISLTFLRFHLTNSFHIAKPIVDEHLDQYFLLYWKPSYFLSQLKDGQIITTDEDNAEVYYWNVIYKSCTPSGLKFHNQIKLSFRAAKPEFDLPRYVLVMVAKPESQGVQ